MLKTRSIRYNPEADDGLRISIMSRHTLKDGVTPDTTILPSMFDEHRPELAPPARLLGDYYKRNKGWNNFERNFRHHLLLPAVAAAVERLAMEALESNVTILCTEHSPDHCHRRLVAEQCQLIVPELTVVVN